MKKEDVEKWLETDEGKEWLDEKKKPLLDKRNQLLDEIASLKNRLAGESEKGNALDTKLNNYLANLTKSHCTRIFEGANKNHDALLKGNNVREFVKRQIEKNAEADGGLIPDIDDSGEFKFATASGKSFEDYFTEWAGTEEAKAFIAVNCTGGGARGSSFGGGGNLQTVKKMTPEEIARNLDSPTFRNSLQS